MLRLLIILNLLINDVYAGESRYVEPSKQLLNEIRKGNSYVFDYADRNPAKIKYREPSNEELLDIKNEMHSAIKEAETAHTLEEYQSEISTIRAVSSKKDLDIGRTLYDLEKMPVPTNSGDTYSSEFSTASDFEKYNDRSIESPVVLVSFSMPNNLIIDYLKEVQMIGGRIVFRGPVEDSLDETIKRISHIIGKNNYRGMSIDPTLFNRFNVESVPAIILPLEPILPCQPDGCPTPKHVKASGLVSIRYFLEKITRVGSVKGSDVANKWLEVIEG